MISISPRLGKSREKVEDVLNEFENTEIKFTGNLGQLHPVASSHDLLFKYTAY